MAGEFDVSNIYIYKYIRGVNIRCLHTNERARIFPYISRHNNIIFTFINSFVYILLLYTITNELLNFVMEIIEEEEIILSFSSIIFFK